MGDIQVGESMGDCTIDTFQVLSPSGRSSPVICGVNGNQHMILDMADDDCAEVVLGLGATTSTTRELSITVTQYACGDHDSAGPPGCLQYFPNESGKIRSFNFRDITPGASVLYNDVHLSAQNYEICIRRGNNMKYICYVPCTTTIGTTEAAGEQLDTLNSFGLSKNGENAASSASQGSLCATDYIYIPLGTYLVGEMAIATENYQVNEIAATTTHRLCGNALNSDIEAGASVSMCSYSVPFNVGVNFDQDEFCTVNTDGDTCEFLGTIAAAGGAGSVGFSLCYVQA